MSDKPQLDRAEVQEDLVEQIISQGLEKMSAPREPSGESPADEAPPAPEKKAEEKTHPSEKRNNRSAAYVYLLILFGAAFFMLLLAYFIQQRNSETTISDLKTTMNLSREELMDEIRALEEEKEQLNAAIQESESALKEEKQQREIAEDLTEINSARAGRCFVELERVNTLVWLERFCTEGDWLMAAALVESDDYFLNEKNRDYERNWAEGREATSVQSARYLALREKVFDNSDCMIVVSWQTSDDGSDYTERPYIDPASGRYDEETVNTAKNLWTIISSYSTWSVNDILPYSSFVMEKVMEFYTDGDIERLNSGDFQPSTVELFAQIVQDLIDQGMITIIGTGVDTEDGTIHLGTAQVEVSEG